MQRQMADLSHPLAEPLRHETIPRRANGGEKFLMCFALVLLLSFLRCGWRRSGQKFVVQSHLVTIVSAMPSNLRNRRHIASMLARTSCSRKTITTMGAAIPCKLRNQMEFATPVSLSTTDLFRPIVELAHNEPERVALEFYDPEASSIASESKSDGTAQHSVAQLSYKDLISRVVRVQRQIIATLALNITLLAREHPPLMLVAVMVDEGPWLPIAQLAIVASGATIVPLDPQEPIPRLTRMVHDAINAGLRLAIVKDDEVRKTFLQCLPKSTRLDIITTAELNAEIVPPASAAAELEMDAPFEHVDKKDPVSHVFFTSGSTGLPKGCICTVSNLAAYCRAKNSAMHIDRASRVFVASAFTFDPSLGDFFATFYAGARLLLTVRNATFWNLGSLLQKSAATHLLTTPTMFGAALLHAESYQEEMLLSAAFPKLQLVALGGEPISRRIFEAFRKNYMRGQSMKLSNMYGVTECCVYQAIHEVNLAPAADPASRMNLGVPLSPNLTLILAAEPGDDVDKVCVEPGAVGEVWVCGDQVGKGYLNNPELSQERFVTHPRLGRCFRTGDMASISEEADASLRLLGRRDGQVKVQGQRVELVEIEDMLLSLLAPAVISEVAVIAVHKHDVDDGPEGETEAVRGRTTLRLYQLVAFCVLSSALLDRFLSSSALTAVQDAEVTRGRFEAALRKLVDFIVRAALPRYMIPNSIRFCRELPKTGTGKVSRKALADDYCAWNTVKEQQVVKALTSNSMTYFERLVSNVWRKELFGDQPLSLQPTDNFHELSGDSLAALRICKALAERLEIEGIGRLWRKKMVPQGTSTHYIGSKCNTENGVDRIELGVHAWEKNGELSMCIRAGPLHPRELLHRPVLRDFAGYLENYFSAEGHGLGSKPQHSVPNDDEDESPLLASLFEAARLGSSALLQVVLAHSGASAFTAVQLHTALTYACLGNHVEVAEILLKDAGAEVTFPSCEKSRHMPLLHAVVQRKDMSSSMVKLLLDYGANPFQRSPGPENHMLLHQVARAGGATPMLDFIAASYYNNEGGHRWTSRRWSPLDVRDGRSRTPLHWAALNGHTHSVTHLLLLRADVTAQDDCHETPLDMALRQDFDIAFTDREGIGDSSRWREIATILSHGGEILSGGGDDIVKLTGLSDNLTRAQRKSLVSRLLIQLEGAVPIGLEIRPGKGFCKEVVLKFPLASEAQAFYERRSASNALKPMYTPLNGVGSHRLWWNRTDSFEKFQKARATMKLTGVFHYLKDEGHASLATHDIRRNPASGEVFIGGERIALFSFQKGRTKLEMIPEACTRHEIDQATVVQLYEQSFL